MGILSIVFGITVYVVSKIMKLLLRTVGSKTYTCLIHS